ncbi:probable cytochrome P450 305a1 [Diorhabda sublineata]|uniref:probable cytochrome P450 305a1 n=1 Tax=Diorhabda sublineata TaxID=1163346 RepID=UPI0024E10F85|nr:probable cytochrome P450 305a1 [Diorhabda sublineata]
MLSILIVTAVTVVIIYFLRYRKPANYPPGPVWYPIVGTTPLLKKLSRALGGQHLGLSKLAEIYNTKVLGLKLGEENVVAVFSYPVVKKVLTEKEYEGRPDNFFLRLRCMGIRRGVTIVDGPLWKTQRKFLVTHLRNVGYGKKSMENLIRYEVEDLLSILRENEDKKIRIGSILSVSVLNVLWALVTGCRLDRGDGRLKRLLDLLDQRSRAFDMSGGTLNQFPWLRFLAPDKTGYSLIKNINSELKDLLLETIKEHFSTWVEGQDNDLIYSFIKEMNNDKGPNSTFTEDQLIMLCLDLFIGGSQTTSNTLDFCFLLMVLRTDIQEKVRNCLNQAFSGQENINYCDRYKVPYVEAVLHEIQRLWNVTPIIGPRRVLEDTVLESYSIPKDTTVLISTYSVHHDKDYWIDPEIFRPERFLDSEGKLIHHERFLPYGLGKRRCLGDVLARSCIFIFFSEIIRNFSITKYPGSETPTEVPLPGITLCPQKYIAKFTQLYS